MAALHDFLFEEASSWKGKLENGLVAAGDGLTMSRDNENKWCK
jgi:hypothetical protein